MSSDQFAKGGATHGGAGERSTRELVAAVFSCVAHDIRAGLNGITLWTHVLERGGPDSAERGVEGVRRAVAQQSGLAQQFSDLGRALHLTADEPARPIDMQGLLREALHSLEPFAAERGVALRLPDEARPVELNGHTRLLQQLLHLLLADVLSSAPQGGSVCATLAPGADAITLELVVLQADGAALEEDPQRPRRTLRRALAALGGQLLDGELHPVPGGVALRLPHAP